MMRGRLYIEDKDIYAEFGMYVEEGGWNELIAYAPMKAVDKNDWHEEDGEEPDLSQPVLDTKEVQIKFAISKPQSRFTDFIEFISSRVYVTFYIPSIQRSYTLRLTSHPNCDFAMELGFVTLKFANDFPMGGYVYEVPSSGIIQTTDYGLDGRMFTEYGARVLSGAISEISKMADVKPNLTFNSKYTNGAKYDDVGGVTYKSKDVKLHILMRATTLTELWINYDALIYDLMRPNERMLWVEDFGTEFPCYYKSCSVTDFYPTEKIWLEFTLTLTFTRDFRIDESETLLAAEDNSIVITETTDEAINMI